jgi:hypothetical protein
MPDNIKWEYLSMTMGTFFHPSKDEEIELQLNEIGEQGWEVVSVYPIEGSNKARVIAKRPLTARTQRQRSMPEY